MRAFQDAGHIGVLIVGDYTTRIGDPSGRSAERPILSDEEIDANAKTYLDQAMVDPRPRSHRGAVQRRVARRSSPTRTSCGSPGRSRSPGSSSATTSRSGWRRSEPISVSELLYPLMQAYDSVAIEADVELGGTDQLYNLLAGREVMPHYGLEPQVVLTTPLLLSLGRGEDELVGRQQHPAHGDAGGDVRPHDANLRRPARAVVRARRRAAVARGRPARGKARARAVHRRPLARGGGGREPPRSISPASCAAARRPRTSRSWPLDGADPVHLPKLLAERAASPARRREARRLIGQGGGQAERTRPSRSSICPAQALAGALLQVGKRRFARLTRRRREALYFLGRPKGRRRTVLQPATKEPPRPDSYPIRFVSTEASGASRRLFYAVTRTTAPVFENSTANVLRVSRPGPTRAVGTVINTSSSRRFFGSGADGL